MSDFGFGVLVGIVGCTSIALLRRAWSHWRFERLCRRNNWR